ncbi:hypothetical protein DFH06DRAFT_1341599 [Mycena polygramma]|nr:hypothetical protein DFH06DRAFT_1341599 [Mycena polygramma]
MHRPPCTEIGHAASRASTRYYSPALYHTRRTFKGTACLRLTRTPIDYILERPTRTDARLWSRQRRTIDIGHPSQRGTSPIRSLSSSAGPPPRTQEDRADTLLPRAALLTMDESSAHRIADHELMRSARTPIYRKWSLQIDALIECIIAGATPPFIARGEEQQTSLNHRASRRVYPAPAADADRSPYCVSGDAGRVGHRYALTLPMAAGADGGAMTPAMTDASRESIIHHLPPHHTAREHFIIAPRTRTRSDPSSIFLRNARAMTGGGDSLDPCVRIPHTSRPTAADYDSDSRDERSDARWDSGMGGIRRVRCVLAIVPRGYRSAELKDDADLASDLAIGYPARRNEEPDARAYLSQASISVSGVWSLGRVCVSEGEEEREDAYFDIVRASSTRASSPSSVSFPAPASRPGAPSLHRDACPAFLHRHSTVDYRHSPQVQESRAARATCGSCGNRRAAGDEREGMREMDAIRDT